MGAAHQGAMDGLCERRRFEAEDGDAMCSRCQEMCPEKQEDPQRFGEGGACHWSPPCECGNLTSAGTRDGLCDKCRSEAAEAQRVYDDRLCDCGNCTSGLGDGLCCSCRSNWVSPKRGMVVQLSARAPQTPVLKSAMPPAIMHAAAAAAPGLDVDCHSSHLPALPEEVVDRTPEQFRGYRKMSSASSDGQLGDAGSARGDGRCSIWAVLVGWSLLQVDNDPLEWPGCQDITQVVHKLWVEGESILNTDMASGQNVHLKQPEDNLVVNRWELDLLLNDLRDTSDVQTLQGSAHLTLLALLLDVRILCWNDIQGDGSILDINIRSARGTIRISTNGAHYSVYSDHCKFRTTRWWDLQWMGHPHIAQGVRMEPYLK